MAALESLRDVLLNASEMFARQEFRKAEIADARAYAEKSLKEQREYERQRLKEEREYAAALRQRINKEELEQIGARAKALSEAELAAAPMRSAAEWAKRAADVGLTYDLNGNLAKQQKDISDAVVARETEKIFAVKLADKKAELDVAKQLLPETQKFEADANKPNIAASQKTFAEAQAAVAAARQEAEAKIAALRAPLEQNFKRASFGIDSSTPMGAAQMQQLQEQFTNSLQALGPQLRIIEASAQAKIAPYADILRTAGTNIVRLGGTLTPEAAPSYFPAMSNTPASGPASVLPSRTPSPFFQSDASKAAASGAAMTAAPTASPPPAQTPTASPSPANDPTVLGYGGLLGSAAQFTTPALTSDLMNKGIEIMKSNPNLVPDLARQLGGPQLEAQARAAMAYYFPTPAPQTAPTPQATPPPTRPLLAPGYWNQSQHGLDATY